MEDKKSPKKTGWRLNVFDIVIIVLVLIAGVVFIMVTRSGSGKLSVTSKSTTVRYTIELTGMPDGTAELIKEGDQVKDNVENNVLGKVVSVKITPYMNSTKNLETGEYVLTEVPNQETASIELESDASETDSAISIGNGFAVQCGVQVHVSGPGYAGNGYITDIERGGDAK